MRSIIIASLGVISWALMVHMTLDIVPVYSEAERNALTVFVQSMPN